MLKLHATHPNSSLWRLIASLLFCSSLFIPNAAKSGELEDGLLTAWEVLWHPTGSPVIISKWGDSVRYRYFGVNIERHRAQLDPPAERAHPRLLRQARLPRRSFAGT